MNNRIDLHNLLLELAGPNVYYQIPSNMKMKYPAVKYERGKIENNHADNMVYSQNTFYNITVISKDPDEPIVKKISRIPTCEYDRDYIIDNLYHTVFKIYY